MAGYKAPVQNSVEALSTWNAMSETLDLHCWVEKDGKIYDYDNDDQTFKMVRMVRGLTDERVYASLNADESKKVWKFVWKKIVKPRTKAMDELSPELKKDCEKHLKESVGKCFLRAYLIQKEIGGGLRFGSQGWKHPNGQVWWEYG